MNALVERLAGSCGQEVGPKHAIRRAAVAPVAHGPRQTRLSFGCLSTHVCQSTSALLTRMPARRKP